MGGGLFEQEVLGLLQAGLAGLDRLLAQPPARWSRSASIIAA
ncbi:MAG: hypothetical protein WAN22_03760 [Solirubrobacteraceae bacterium]